VAWSPRSRAEPLIGKADWIAEIRATYGEDAEEELDCVPKAGAGSWLKPEFIAACEHAEAGKPELYAGGLIYLGRDVARRRDLAVMHGYELVGDVLWLRDRWLGRRHLPRAGRPFDEIFAPARGRLLDRPDRHGREGGRGRAAPPRRDRVQGLLLSGPNRLDIATAWSTASSAA
jgi:hypothetical protein